MSVSSSRLGGLAAVNLSHPLPSWEQWHELPVRRRSPCLNKGEATFPGCLLCSKHFKCIIGFHFPHSLMKQKLLKSSSFYSREQ